MIVHINVNFKCNIIRAIDCYVISGYTINEIVERVALYHETAESFKQTFGEPLKEQEQNGMVSALWRHENNTQLLIQIVPVGESAIIQVGVADITLLSIE